MRTAILITAAIVLLAPGVASAEFSPDSSSIERHKNRLQADLGVASAVGEIGVSYTYAPLPQAQIEIGTGLGFSGYQLSIMPKVSLGRSSNRLVIGTGLSSSLDSSSHPDRSYVGYWLNAEVGYEYRSASGYSVLLAVGLTYGLGGTMPTHCIVDCASDAESSVRQVAGLLYPQGRIAIGRWF